MSSNTTTSSSSVDASLWWDPFAPLFSQLENSPLSSDLPPSLAKKLKENHTWFVDTVSRFKTPNAKSREALNSNELLIGTHQLTVKPELKDKALRISTYLCLDEVQSYIIVQRALELNGMDADSVAEEYLHVVLIQYYIERQCLLKCVRQIITHALYIGIGVTGENVVKGEALKLISDGLERKLISVLQDLLSSYHPEDMDVDLFTLWAEETLIEDNLIMDVLFLIYYESLCTCNGETWKTLCSLYEGMLSGACNVGKLEVSAEALNSSYHAKVQLLLILMETLDLENLLRLVHDAIPFRQGASSFSITDIQQIDSLISSSAIFEMKEGGPLILTWAVFLCLTSSLPGNEENTMLMEIDHVGYIRQAFDSSALNYFLEILDIDLLKEPDGPITGYRSVLRTFISAFIASYEINLQLEDSTLNLILGILCRIYRGEESLCVQFWDKESFIDGPIRCLLCSLEGEFPFRILELVRLLSSLCEGSWPSECVYNFLDRSVGISTLFEITKESWVDNATQIVETHRPLYVPGVENLIVPSKTRGHVLRMISGNTALVRWEHTQSGMIILLLRLAQELQLESNEEVLPILDLLSRMVSFNSAVTSSLLDIGNSFNFEVAEMDGQLQKRLWVAEVICSVLRKLHPNAASAALMSLGIRILTEMLRCDPSRTTSTCLKENVFEMAMSRSTFDYDGSARSWLLSGKLAKMLLIDSEENATENPLAISVLDFTMQLVEKKLENDLVVALVVFVLQYLLVNHEHWRYKLKNVRWRITLKVLEATKGFITSITFYKKLGAVIHDLLLSDSSIHTALFHLVCVTKQTLESIYVSRHFELVEIEGFQRAICSALDVLLSMVSKFSVDNSSGLPVFHQAILSSMTKPVSVVTAMMSLITYSQNSAIQIGAARLLFKLFVIAYVLQPNFPCNIFFDLDDKQITDMRHVVKRLLLEQSEWNKDLFLAVVDLLISAAWYQPAFLLTLVAPKEGAEVQSDNCGDLKDARKESFALGPNKSNMVDGLVQYVERSNDLIGSNSSELLTVLEFLRALWQGAGYYLHILEYLKGSGKFWKQLSDCVSSLANLKASSVQNMTEAESRGLAHKYQCQSIVLEIMAYELFLNKKLLHAERLLCDAHKLKEGPEIAASKEKLKSANVDDLTEILSSWSERSILRNMVDSYSCVQYDNRTFYRVKVAVSLLFVHVMEKLSVGNPGSLALSLLGEIRIMFEKIRGHPAFSELLTQYSLRGYSEGKQIECLIFNDLFYHLQGELEGREIGAGPFKELSRCLIESNCMQIYRQKECEESFAIVKDIYLYDLPQIREDLGLDVWEYTDWKQSKKIAHSMLDCMQQANSVVLFASSILSALRSLISFLTMYENGLLEGKAKSGAKIPIQLSVSCIDMVCQCFNTTVASLDRVLDISIWIPDFLSAQAELLLLLVRSAGSSLSASVALVVLKTSTFGLKILFEFRASEIGFKKTSRLLLMLLILAAKFSKASDFETNGSAEVSNACLSLLPVLCNYIGGDEHYVLSLASIDLILRKFLMPATWFPILVEHLQWHHVVVKLLDQSSIASIQITLKFLLTLAHVKGSAKMLLDADLFPSLRVLFSNLTDCLSSSAATNYNGFLKTSGKMEKPEKIWGLGLAVITAVVHTAIDSSLSHDILDSLVYFLFSEKAYLISYYLNAPDFPSNDHDKKRPRAQRAQTSLTFLMGTEQTLVLMCTLAKYQGSWPKSMKEIDPHLWEKSIHLLAFISRGSHRFGESPSRTAPLVCPPASNEELESCKRPSFICSRNGWFSLSPFCCQSKPNFASVSVNSAALIVRDQSVEGAHAISPTHFSDLVALQIYRIAVLLLKFLCLEAKRAAKRSEEVGFIDVAHIPELPMPEILHGLQDQAVAIVSELCNANKSKQVSREIQSICLLLLQIMEMTMYLEFCVMQICGIRPVLGRLDDFSKEAKLLFKAMEGHSFLNAPLRSLKQIILLTYPGFLQSEGFL